tara:strand:- start:740 stop:1339 length:600 start_codon:yes stop_codon:yes gene_type:complete
LIFPLTSKSAELPENINFLVTRNGKEFGFHKIVFKKQDNEDLIVSINIELEVKLGFVKLFSYKHENKETWRNGKLFQINTTTYDNGKNFFINGKSTKEGFIINTQDGTKVLPLEIVPTSYWNYLSIKNKNWLDTQRGIPLNLNISYNGVENIESFHGKKISAERYDISNDLNLSLWYHNNSLVKIAFVARGNEIDYFMR